MTLLFKLLTDSFWYLCLMAPVLQASGRGPGLFFLLPIPVWWAWLFRNRKKRDVFGVLKDQFILETKLLLGIGFFELLFLGPVRWQTVCGRFAALFLLGGVLLLRAGRLTEEGAADGSFWRRSGGSVLALTALAAFFAFPPVYQGVLGLLGFFYQRLILPLLMVILELLLGAFSWIAGFFPEAAPMEAEHPVEISDWSLAEWAAETTETGQAPAILRLLGRLLPVLFLLILLYFLYRKLTDMGNRSGEKIYGTVERSGIPAEKRPSGRILGLFEKRNVRYYYRRFLLLCRKRGIVIPDSATSRRIEENAQALWPGKELFRFHEIYRNVRYGEYPETEREVKEARELYRRFSETGKQENG